MSEPGGEITVLLRRWSGGDSSALEPLMTAVYVELRRIARRRMRLEPAGHTLQTTALVHEAYLRLVGQRRTNWQNRGQFYNVAARVMRRVLVDQARRRRAGKRGGGDSDLPLEETLSNIARSGVDVVALDDALEALAVIDGRQARIVEMKFFVGLTVEEIAELVSLSPASVKRHWDTARMWLRREMGGPR